MIRFIRLFCQLITIVSIIRKSSGLMCYVCAHDAEIVFPSSEGEVGTARSNKHCLKNRPPLKYIQNCNVPESGAVVVCQNDTVYDNGALVGVQRYCSEIFSGGPVKLGCIVDNEEWNGIRRKRVECRCMKNGCNNPNTTLYDYQTKHPKEEKDFDEDSSPQLLGNGFNVMIICWTILSNFIPRWMF